MEDRWNLDALYKQVLRRQIDSENGDKLVLTVYGQLSEDAELEKIATQVKPTGENTPRTLSSLLGDYALGKITLHRLQGAAPRWWPMNANEEIEGKNSFWVENEIEYQTEDPMPQAANPHAAPPDQSLQAQSMMGLGQLNLLESSFNSYKHRATVAEKALDELRKDYKQLQKTYEESKNENWETKLTYAQNSEAEKRKVNYNEAIGKAIETMGPQVAQWAMTNFDQLSKPIQKLVISKFGLEEEEAGLGALPDDLAQLVQKLEDGTPEAEQLRHYFTQVINHPQGLRLAGLGISILHHLPRHPDVLNVAGNVVKTITNKKHE